MKLHTVVAFVFVAAFSLHLMAADAPVPFRKALEFRVQKGAVIVQITAGLPWNQQASSLTIASEYGTNPTLTEETEFLRETLRQMPAFGADPRKISFIILSGIRESEVRQRLATAALHSKQWRLAIKTSKGISKALVELLNSIGAYDAFNDVFNNYGLKVVVGAAENIAVEEMMVSNTSDRYKVPIDANLTLNLERNEK